MVCAFSNPLAATLTSEKAQQTGSTLVSAGACSFGLVTPRPPAPRTPQRGFQNNGSNSYGYKHPHGGPELGSALRAWGTPARPAVPLPVRIPLPASSLRPHTPTPGSPREGEEAQDSLSCPICKMESVAAPPTGAAWPSVAAWGEF